MLMKSLMAPLLKCGVDSATTDIDKLGVFKALSIRMAKIAIVLPALEPPCITLIRDLIFLILDMALVYLNFISIL
jgi:hypothetical protein